MKQKGMAIGVSVAFHGLCGFLYTVIAWQFFSKLNSNGEKKLEVAQFVLFVGVSVLVMNLLASAGIFLAKTNQSSNYSTVPYTQDSSLDSFELKNVDDKDSDTSLGRRRSLFKSWSSQPDSPSLERYVSPIATNSTLLESDASLEDISTPPSLKSFKPKVEMSAFYKPEFYILGYVLFSLTGTGLMYVTSIGSIGEILKFIFNHYSFFSPFTIKWII